MSDQTFITPPFISSLSRWMVGFEARQTSGGLSVATNAWPTANLAIYIPFELPWPYTVQRVWWNNGTAAGGNWNIGLFTITGRQLYSAGSTAASGNSVPQYVTLSSPLLLPAGRYYIGVSHSATTANHAFGTTTVSAIRNRTIGILQEASALTLPTNMTGAAKVSTLIPICGITRTSSGG
jgi:hypothetical protein